MVSRAFAVASCLSFAALLSAGPSAALELPLPPEGEDIVGQIQVIKAKYEDTFAAIGEAHDLGYLELVAANPGVDPWLPGEGTDIILPTRFILPPGPREGIVINIAEYRMYYYPEGKNVVHTFPLGIGREGWGSPVGTARITAMTSNPAWYPPKSIREEHAADGDPLPTVVPPGPDNPLGPYKMSLSLPGYLIHGSNKKFGIGMRVSHGCFRMLNHNVLELAKMVKVGTPVRIVDEPYKFGVSEGKVYLEAHAPLEDGDQKTLTLMDKHAVVINTLLKRDEAAGKLHLDWEMVREIIAGEDGLPIQIAEQRTEVAVHEEQLFSLLFRGHKKADLEGRLFCFYKLTCGWRVPAYAEHARWLRQQSAEPSERRPELRRPCCTLRQREPGREQRRLRSRSGELRFLWSCCCCNR